MCELDGCEFKGDVHIDCTERLICTMKQEILRHQKATNDEFKKNQEKLKRSEEKLKHCEQKLKKMEDKLKEKEDKCEELKSKLHEKTRECARLEKKYKDLKEKGEQPQSKILFGDQAAKVVKRRSSVSKLSCDTPKKIKKEKDDEMHLRSIPSNVQIANASKGPKDDDGKIFKRSRGPSMFETRAKSSAKSGKENSPKKVRKTAEPSALLKTVDPSKKTKQTTLQFMLAATSTKTSVELPENADEDMTYCEEAEQAPKTLNGWIARPSIGLNITKKPAHRKSNMNGDLFNFAASKVSPVIEHETEEEPDISKILKVHEDPDRTPDISQVVIKQEKLSIHCDEKSMDNLFGPSDDEAFIKSSQESSVFVIEPEEELPIMVEDSGPSTQTREKWEKMLQRDMLKPINPYEMQGSPEKPFVPPRKRKGVYAECDECCEYYDRYAAIVGPTQAESTIWECPNKCKGYRVRKNFAQPIIPARVIVTRPDGETPEGFWDLSII